MLKWDPKDPNDVDSFGVDWETRLSGDTIASSIWLIGDDEINDADTDLVQDSKSNTTVATTVWLSGGALDEDYEVTNRITTVGGRTIDQTVKLRIRAG